MGAFDKLFGCLNDAVTAIAREQQETSQKRYGNSEQKERELLLLQRYVNTMRTQRTMARNKLIIRDLTEKLKTQEQGSEAKKAVKPDELVQMYGRLVQDVEDLESLDESPEFSDTRKGFLGMSLLFKAFRCFFLAMVFVGRSKYPEAVALYERSGKLARAAIEEQSQCAQPDTASIDEATQLIKRVRGECCVVQARAFMEEKKLEGAVGDMSLTGKVDLGLLERIDVWNEKSGVTNVIEFPPAFEAVPCKPIFFDLAFNHVKEFPDMSEHVEKQKGFFGKAKSMFGW